MGRLSVYACVALQCLVFAPIAAAEIAVRPDPDVATPVPQVVVPIPGQAPPPTVTPIEPPPTVVPIPQPQPVVTPIPPEPVERPQPPPPERVVPTAPHFAMSADVTFGAAFPISSGLAADERIGETFRYHVGRSLDGFYLGLAFGQVLDSNGVFLQFANRFGWDLWFRIDDSLSFGVDFYVALGMFYFAPISHSGATPEPGFASLELENGLELKLYFAGGLYLVARPVGLAYMSPGGIGGGLTLLDVSGGVGFAF